MNNRESGILLHITSLPSSFGIGDLGPCAYRFIDFLAETKQRLWQILPINPTDIVHDNSPYHSISAFAFNPLLISPELLFRDGFISKSDIKSIPDFQKERVDFQTVTRFKSVLFEQCFEKFNIRKGNDEFDEFCAINQGWLEDFALFITLKLHFKNKAWNHWPEDLRDRETEALNEVKRVFKDQIKKYKFIQWLFFRQWNNLKNYCSDRGIKIFGDIPIYVVYDSVDVWVNSNIFHLDINKNPITVAGVPPDYFSQNGQLWGNPVYSWDTLKETGYHWWIKRIKHNLKLFDLVRIDHFRGFVGYWEVPFGEENAINGRWIEAPAEDFFNTIIKNIPITSIIAEDLGTITQNVRDIMDRFKFPGMKVLQFAFGDDLAANPYVPHNHIENCIVYTGTHDNNTARGWIDNEATPETKERFFKYISRCIPLEEVSGELIRMAMMSVAKRAITPMQDIIGLGSEALMNRPSTKNGNWKWRMQSNQITQEIINQHREMTEIYGRA